MKPEVAAKRPYLGKRAIVVRAGFGKLAAAVALATFAVPNLTFAQQYTQTNLISDIPGMAAQTDPNLQNSWGLTRFPYCATKWSGWQSVVDRQ